MTTETLTYEDCLDFDPCGTDCAGAVEYRIAMSPTGRSFPRCDDHFESRWQEQERISSTYGVPLTYTDYGDYGWSDDYSDY